HRAEGRGGEPARGAQRLPVPPALPAGVRSLPGRAPAAAHGRRRTRGGVPPERGAGLGPADPPPENEKVALDTVEDGHARKVSPRLEAEFPEEGDAPLVVGEDEGAAPLGRGHAATHGGIRPRSARCRRSPGAPGSRRCRCRRSRADRILWRRGWHSRCAVLSGDATYAVPRSTRRPAW